MNVKVLIISDYRDPISSRPEAEFLIPLVKEGIDITIMTFGDAEYVKRFKEVGINVIDFHPVKKFDKPTVQYIKNELIKGKYHILHLFNNKAIINGIKAAKGLPVKVVLYRGYTGNMNWWDPTAYLKFLHPRVDKIMCLTDSVKNSIAKSMIFGDKKKLITINKGHLLSWYKKDPINRSEIGIPDNAFLAVNVANARSMKGTKYLLKSTYHLPKGLPIHYIIIGNGRDTKKHLKLKNNSPYKNNIHFAGFRSDAHRIVSASNTFILSSIKGEAITKSVFESMCLGVTPIITDIPGNIGLVINNESGIVIPKKNSQAISEAVMTLYNNRDLLEKYGQAAQNHIDKKFNNSKTVKEVNALYTQLASEV